MFDREHEVRLRALEISHARCNAQVSEALQTIDEKLDKLAESLRAAAWSGRALISVCLLVSGAFGSLVGYLVTR